MKEAQLEHKDINWIIRKSAFSDDLWVQFKQQALEATSKDNPVESIVSQFSKATGEMQLKMQQFSDFLRHVPLLAPLGHWIKGISTMDQYWQEKYRKGMKDLLDKRLIPILNSQKENITLEEFQQIGHQTILENIRCVKEWNFIQKEEAVQCYVQFSHSLSRWTMNLIPPGFDPDRERMRNRPIKYDTFIEFVQHLSERDALIAKLLYFGAPTMEGVLSLRKEAINATESFIAFSEGEVVFPRHVIQDLLLYVKDNSNKQELVFTNVRGREVERAHLNQSFARACEKLSTGIKITPGSLLKLKNENSGYSLDQKLNF